MLWSYRGLITVGVCLTLCVLTSRAEAQYGEYYGPDGERSGYRSVDSGEWEDFARGLLQGNVRDGRYRFRLPLGLQLDLDVRGDDRYDRRDPRRDDRADRGRSPQGDDYEDRYYRDRGYREPYYRDPYFRDRPSYGDRGRRYDDRRYDRGRLDWYDARRVAFLADDLESRVEDLIEEAEYDPDDSQALRRLEKLLDQLDRAANELNELADQGRRQALVEQYLRFNRIWGDVTNQLWQVRWEVEGKWQDDAQAIRRIDSQLYDELVEGRPDQVRDRQTQYRDHPYQLAWTADRLLQRLENANLRDRDELLERAERFASAADEFYQEVKASESFPEDEFSSVDERWRELDRRLSQLSERRFPQVLELARRIDYHVRQIDARIARGG